MQSLVERNPSFASPRKQKNKSNQLMSSAGLELGTPGQYRSKNENISTASQKLSQQKNELNRGDDNDVFQIEDKLPTKSDYLAMVDSGTRNSLKRQGKVLKTSLSFNKASTSRNIDTNYFETSDLENSRTLSTSTNDVSATTTTRGRRYNLDKSTISPPVSPVQKVATLPPMAGLRKEKQLKNDQNRLSFTTGRIFKMLGRKWSTGSSFNQVDPLDVSERYKYEEEEENNDSKKKKDKKKKTTRHGSDAKNSDRVRSKLKKFIQKRPTMESLQERGIIKETVFGCPLDKLCEKEKTTVPDFVKLCVGEVEKRGLDIDGIYRVSGNLSHVQKLRYMIDRDEEVDLSDPQWSDIHLVTGALKMFLRELPEPVIPFNFFDKFIAACKIQDSKQRVAAMLKLVEILPKPNKDTLTFLMTHFHRVVEHSTKNRMQVQNVAIVFGPTLLLKPDDQKDQSAGGHMAIYMVYQNQIIDVMLTEYATIFKK